MKLSAKDLYNLRRARLELEGKALEAQSAQHQFQRLLLEVQRKYGLLDSEATLDIATGEVQRSEDRR